MCYIHITNIVEVTLGCLRDWPTPSMQTLCKCAKLQEALNTQDIYQLIESEAGRST